MNGTYIALVIGNLLVDVVISENLIDCFLLVFCRMYRMDD